MAGIILKFDIEQDSEAIKDAINGFAYRMVIQQLDQLLRSTVRREVSILNNEPATSLEVEVAEAYRDKIRELLTDNHVIIEL